MSLPILLLIVATVAYGIGATPFGFLAGKILRGIDIRDHGSGNIGATNALRILGKPAGITVFILDFLKGLIPVILAGTFAAKFADASSVALVQIVAALGSILGHNFTFWLRFKGGKGIATSGGALLGVLPMAVAAGLVAWLVLFFTTRYVAIASIGAAVAIPIAVLITGLISNELNVALLVFSLVLAILAVVRHRSNIERLRAGTELRFESKKKTTS